MIPRLLALCIVVAWMGCAGSERPAGPQPLERIELAELWTTGRTEGNGPDLFGEIEGLLLDALGRLHVLEGTSEEVRIFDPDGRFVRAYARAGSGPGELTGPAGLAICADEEIWILDVTNNRYSVYDTAGIHVTDLRRPAAGYSRPWMGGFDGEGHLLDVTFRPGPDGNELILVRSRVARDTAGMPVAVQPTDTFPLPRPAAERFLVTEVDGTGRRRQVSVAIPFTTGLRRELSPDGRVWQAHTDRYRLVEFVPGGDTVRRVERPAEAESVLPRELDSALVALGERTSPGIEYDRTRIPGTWPVLEGFFADGSGRLWVRPIERPPVPGFDLLDATGHWVRLESDVRLETLPTPAVRGDTIWAVVRSELGVARIRKSAWRGR